MKRLALASLILLAGCGGYYTGPAQVSSCLQDQRVMETYRRFAQTDPDRVLLGGLSRTGSRVNCYWGQSRALANLPDSQVYKRCQADSASCTLLARGTEIKFEPETGSSGSSEVAWFIVGALAGGVVESLMAPAPKASAAPAAEPRPLSCRPSAVPIMGAPEYECR